MERRNENSVYVNMMVDTLKRKKQILLFLLEKTKEQESLLKDEEMNPEEFTKTIEEKGDQIDEINRMDEGFDTLFKHVEKEILANRMAYKEQIQQILDSIVSDGFSWELSSFATYFDRQYFVTVRYGVKEAIFSDYVFIKGQIPDFVKISEKNN